MDKIKEACDVAIKSLRSCYGDRGIVAGKHQFDAYWARDSFFAAYGSLGLGDFVIVKRQLKYFLKKSKNLHIPRRVMHRHTWLRDVVRIKFFGNLFTYKSRDQNSLYIICFNEYVKKSRDIKFLKKNYSRIKKVLDKDFKFDIDRNLLLEQGFYADWADSIRKRGEILYTNVCHYAALNALAELATTLNKWNDRQHYEFLAGKVKEKLNTFFWNGKYYADSLGKGGDIFSSGANMLAIIWGIADRKKSLKIIDFVKKNKLESFTLATNYPEYHFWQISPLARIVGIPDYHNGLRWLWLGCADVLAKLKLGMKKDAKNLLGKIADKIIEYNDIYEVYEQNGKPVNRLFYKSEVPFAWSAGLFVYAVREFERKQSIFSP